ncbi:flagellar basal body P-ring protein FlgI [Rosenbergiella australiborealis]|uniref:Flagellar P-ring protein n=1 Tax=Rosenbergiella australiborealis TaxID=1544696 RepID=A0ABS5T6N3_9GAMM|nr:flagellar basal body P-ring protein FlgI [Rosenbergiella australiborealis]MBT0726628.1 flagellar basal body P-ring protein FlgI [Rosenbergiella australiborealis]
MFMALCISLTTSAQTLRIKDITQVQGVRDNALIGYGLVVGLDGTGDQTTQTPFTTQSMSNMLSQLGITLPSGTNLQLKNVAAVMVTAKLPAFARQGQKVDVVVSSMGNAKSLRGGTLLLTPLKGVDNQVYALAQGNILIGGAGAQAGGSSVQVNQLNGGRISGGATVERELVQNFGDKNQLVLQLSQQDFTLVQRVTDVINQYSGYPAASPLDAGSIAVKVSPTRSSQVQLLAALLDLPVTLPTAPAKVVINSRTGSVIMNQQVSIARCAVAQGNLSVTIDSSTKVDQPDTPLAGGKTVASPQTTIAMREKGGALHKVKASASLNDVVAALNTLGASPTELMSLLQAMDSAGCLNAELEIL